MPRLLLPTPLFFCSSRLSSNISCVSPQAYWFIQAPTFSFQPSFLHFPAMESIAQRPPIIILDRIIYYLKPGKSIRVGQHGLKPAYAILMPVSHVCQSWRQTSLGHIFRCVYVGTNTQPSLNWAHKLGACDLIKGITIKLQTNNIFQNPEAALLRQHVPSDLTLPSIRSLTFIFNGTSNRVNPQLAKLHSHQFGDELFRIFPSITHIVVKYSWDLSRYILPSYIVDLLKCLLAGRAAITAGGNCLSYVLPFPVDTTPLQSFVTSACGKMENTFALIRQNSQSLQQLRLRLSEAVLIRRIVADSDGSVVVYPKLHDLRLCTMDNSRNVAARSSSAGVPFPALKTLVIHGRNSFLDDSILRGSEDSLTFLDMHVWNSTIETLIRANLLDKGQFRALEFLRLRTPDSSPSTITEDHIPVILCAFHRTPVIEVSNGFYFDYAVLQPHIDSFAPTLRSLKIPGVKCTSEQVLHLIGSLPFLRELSVTCRRNAALGDTADLPDMVKSLVQVGLTKNDAVNLIGHICRAMTSASSAALPGSPISKTLQSITIFPSECEGYVQSARLIISLALRCPTVRTFRSFSCIDIVISRSDLMRVKHFVELATRLSTDSN
ncbi:hypothetical protein DL89DRAFT_260114 [Linderina pennispora]|uniref:Uncharacterized protein n=1 Tax=Linderina pennispora TaxID=61395 RepID=A0A1Y1W038_9FUNG|nr:uncharacterized protein DL89DRAFT_260114 [Linderina pennispora]ORX66464.1 hypothetical protein DL89DRAFT_260114 [Linderina pennispora]